MTARARVVIGVAGPMGAGKSSAAERLSKRFGALALSVDQERREIESEIPPGSRAPLDFEKRWEAVRGAARARLIAKIHEASGPVLLEWARLCEDGMLDLVDAVLLLDCPEAERIARLEGGDLPREELVARMAAQAEAKTTSLELAARGVKAVRLDSSRPIPDADLFEAFDELTGAEFSSSASFCLFRIPRAGGRAIWEVTNSCNYGCRYCIFSSTPRRPEGEISPERALSLVDELSERGFTHLKITGGEPFSRPDLMDILRRARERGLRVDLSTNASLIDSERARALSRMGLDMVHVSLDGHTREIQESARGARTWAPTIAGIEALAASGVPLRVGCAVFRGNQDRMAELALLCADLRAHQIIFSLMEPAGRLKPGSPMISNLDRGALLAQVELARAAAGSRIEVVGNFPGPVAAGCGKCPGGSKFIFVDHRGRVSPCTWVAERAPSFSSKLTLEEASLAELLEAPENVGFRRVASSLARSGLDVCPMKIAPDFERARQDDELFEGDAEADLARGGRFSSRAPVYARSNENVGGWMGLLRVAGARVLSVGGSGDALLCALALGARSASSFDLNALARHVAEAKLAALDTLSRSEFADLFERFDSAAYRRARDAMPLASRHFFDLAFERFDHDGSALASSALVRPAPPRALWVRNLPFLADDEAFDRARLAARGRVLDWRTGDAGDAASGFAAEGREFDVVALSNLADYADLACPESPAPLASFRERVCLPMSNLLAPAGRMLAAYAFGAPEGCAPRSAVDDPRLRRAQLAAPPGFSYREESIPGAWGGPPDLGILWERAP